MLKTWLGWLNRGEHDGVERRSEIVPAAEPITDADFDERTGALKWERFMVMLEAERRERPGCLLLIDLSAQSQRMAEAVPGADDDVLPLLARALRQAIREDDLVAHSDGYRFVILLRGASQEIGLDVSARVQNSVDDTIFITAAGVLPLQVAVERVALDEIPSAALR